MRKKDLNDGQLSLFEPAEEKIIKQEYSDIMKQSYIDYLRVLEGTYTCGYSSSPQLCKVYAKSRITIPDGI